MFYELAERTLALERSGKKILRLNIGDTNLPAPRCAVEAAVKSMKEGKSGYGAASGLREFRELIAAREGCSHENVVVGPGSKHLLFALLSLLAGKGKSVALPLPSWPAYSLICAQLGSKLKTVDSSLEKNWEFNTLPKADVAVICNPLNPTSTIYKSSGLRSAIEEAEKNGTHVIVDEAYRGIAFEKFPKLGSIRLRSFSKEFSLESWRLGYAIAPENIAKKLERFNQITCTCVPGFIQAAGVACIENEKELLNTNRKIWKQRADAACSALRAHGFKFATPQSGIYAFATHEGIGDSDEYVIALLEKGVAVAPGSEFGAPGFIRICLNQPSETLKEAIGKMAQALN